MLKFFKVLLALIITVIAAGVVMPEKLVIPVKDASPADWNHQTFWYEPWGASGVHKGIDIFGKKHTPVVSATDGLVVFTGQLKNGGNVVAMLGPKWRIHYVAHLESSNVKIGQFLAIDTEIGTLGDSGNAKGKAPHVHYSIFSILPMPWLIRFEAQGWKRMFYLDPHKKLMMAHIF